MEKSEILEVFVEQFNEFIDDVNQVFPDDKEIALLKDHLYLYSLVNQLTLLKIWQKYIGIPYQTEIEKKNYSFFINKNYEKDLSNTVHTNTILNKIETLRTSVKKMDDTNKIKAFKYIENLTKLANLYNS